MSGMGTVRAEERSRCSCQETRRPKRRYLDVVKEGMQEVGAKDADAFDRSVWRIQ